jgi:polyisoprenoid-binding protein YceI
MNFKYLTAFLFSILLFTQPVWAAHYEIDKDHSSVGFKIKHLFSHVTGSFNDFEGVIDYEPGKPETWKAEATVQAASIDTNNAKRDEHLRKPDFFDVEKYPTLTFKSTKVESTGENTAKMEGLLSMHGVEKPVTFDVQLHGMGNDPWGNSKAGFSATAKIDRKDFGIIWNQALDAGGLMLGEQVEIILEIEANQKEAEPEAKPETAEAESQAA